MEGIEPTLLAEHDFESCASTSSATRAWRPLYIRPTRPSIHRPCFRLQDRQIAGKWRLMWRGGEEAMKKSWTDRIRSEPAAVAALAVFALSAAALAGAWYFQLVVGLPPCPLCLEERIPYHVVIPLALLMAIAALVRAPQKLLMVGFIAIIVAVACNAVLSTYHAGVEWHWWAGPTDCTGPLTDLRAGGSLLSQLQSIHVVRCDEAAWRWLGISLAGYNALISLALAAIAGYGLLARKPA